MSIKVKDALQFLDMLEKEMRRISPLYFGNLDEIWSDSGCNQDNMFKAILNFRMYEMWGKY